jgi:predicted glycogen debranching enzyme
MTPEPGSRRQRFVGDRVRFRLTDRDGQRPPPGWQALLRTNLGRAELLRQEILQAHTRGLSLAGAAWRDVPMVPDGQGWSLELPLTEVGYFKAKAYLLDPRGWQCWPEGPDVGLAVHPDRYRTGNTLYCAFPRMFGPSRFAHDTAAEEEARSLPKLDEAGYTVIPPSGKLRDLIQQLPHIVEKLGCRILHLLPVSNTPTTYARFGRFGSPYAVLDLKSIDPALVVFDQRTTGVDQFRELTFAAHLLGARVFLDIVINHTGWGSVLQDDHPEWFLRHPDGRFASPGAWGTTWEDLVELKHQNVGLWDELSEIFLTWCRRGVDGFRCDAGYKVPVAAWQYIVARVQQEYPETMFLLEGLGGAWEATEELLTEGGLQWAYSELFQNYSGLQVGGYLDHSLQQSQRVGLLVHYSETHDNARLAAQGRAWSLLRNRLCALASVSGGFGFTCGVEWLATEKIRVHGSTGMAWDNPENLIPELARLNQLLLDHPCFFDGARLSRLSPVESPVYALLRRSEEELDEVLVLVNTDVAQPHTLALRWTGTTWAPADSKRTPASGSARGATEPSTWLDLLGQPIPQLTKEARDVVTLNLAPGACYCLAPAAKPQGLHGADYRRARAQAAWALAALSRVLPAERIGPLSWRALALQVDRSPERLLAAISSIEELRDEAHLAERLQLVDNGRIFPPIITWTARDRRRVTPVPPGHWLLVRDPAAFRAALHQADGGPTQNLESIATQEGHIVCFAPRQMSAEATLFLERYTAKDSHLQASIRFLSLEPAATPHGASLAPASLRPTDLVLLTNGRGGMARLCVDLGRVQSKYDCVLGANLHPTLPVDRHVFAKRIRVWVNADGFISPLDFQNLAAFRVGPPATWYFVANAGDGRSVEIQVVAEMLEGRNTTAFHFSRPTAAQASGKQLPPEANVRLTVRLDIEDRSFHQETHRNGGADYHFSVNTRSLPAGQRRARQIAAEKMPLAAEPGEEEFIGFAFTPATDRKLRVFSDKGRYHPQPEWSADIPHPIEQSRGQVGSGDAFSPGWFEIPLPKGESATLAVTADPTDPEPQELEPANRRFRPAPATAEAQDAATFYAALRQAIDAFLVRRGEGKTVIAGYPWFLDWGRDTFICARGLLAAGMTEAVKQLLLTFAPFERQGTLPNTIFGEDASNRDTSDAPLWYGLVYEEYATAAGPLESLAPVLESIGRHYCQGTPNGIRMDPASGLIWSPRHFTWMDTNYPACTPREGYPVEIQALWIRLLLQLARIGTPSERDRWASLAALAQSSLERLFWREPLGFYSDVLLAGPGQPAAEAIADDALRSNCLLLVSLGLSSGERAKRCVAAAIQHLVVPGALRSLAPLPVSVPVPNYGNDGRLLNDPHAPYWGHYEGDEDTRRKPAYHNGTAWTWPFPVFCEALVRAWEFAPAARAAARAYLGTMAGTMQAGCLGHIPEVVDGDAPHTFRGCDAQAWGATEALRVWKLLEA